MPDQFGSIMTVNMMFKNKVSIAVRTMFLGCPVSLFFKSFWASVVLKK